jgi:spore photoproduct lyase
MGTKVTTKEYVLLDGSRRSLVQKVGDGSIIIRFDKTPLPINPKDVVCPHFLELKWAYGCPFDCAWCYLKGTFRFQPTGTKPVLKPLSKMRAALGDFFKANIQAEVLNSGEIADSLMFENGGEPFTKTAIPLFEGQDKHKILLVTKSTNIKNLLSMDSHRQAIISFSLNADPVARRWEKGAPLVSDRLEAVAKLSRSGYEVRIRIDPMVPIVDWRKHYKALIDQIFDKLTPERITIGSLRGLQSTINGVEDKTWIKYLKENSGWGKRIEFNARYWMYRTIIDYLGEKHDYPRVALCKETVEMWEKMGMNYKLISCNCIW